MAEFQQSDLSQAAFAREQGISEKLVSYWVRRVRALQAAAAQSKAAPTGSLVHVADVDGGGQVVPVAVSESREVRPTPTVTRSAAGVGIEVRCGGRSLMVGPGFDRVLLRELVQTLEGLPPC